MQVGPLVESQLPVAEAGVGDLVHGIKLHVEWEPLDDLEGLVTDRPDFLVTIPTLEDALNGEHHPALVRETFSGRLVELVHVGDVLPILGPQPGLTGSGDIWGGVAVQWIRHVWRFSSTTLSITTGRRHILPGILDLLGKLKAHKQRNMV